MIIRLRICRTRMIMLKKIVLYLFIYLFFTLFYTYFTHVYLKKFVKLI